MSLRNFSVTAPLTDYVTRDPADTDIAHATRCARGFLRLTEQGRPIGDLDCHARPEALVTTWTVSYGEGRDEMFDDGDVDKHSMPARVVVTLAVQAGRSMEQVDAALRLLGQRVHAAAQREQGAPAASVMN